MDVPNANYRLIGGDPALDLINTASWYPVAGARGRDPLDAIGKERLVAPGDVVRWGITAGLLPAGTRSADPSTRSLHRLRRLRGAAYHLFKASVEGWTSDPADVDVLDAEGREARSAQRLVGGKGHLGWAWRDDPAPEAIVIRRIALAATTLLTSEAIHEVKQCAGDLCGWLFLDTSRNRRRRWCEMADCGNLAKVRRFRGTRK